MSSGSGIVNVAFAIEILMTSDESSAFPVTRWRLQYGSSHLANGEGRFITCDAATLQKLDAAGRLVLR